MKTGSLASENSIKRSDFKVVCIKVSLNEDSLSFSWKNIANFYLREGSFLFLSASRQSEVG